MINFEKYGFEPDSEYKELYWHKVFPFEVTIQDGYFQLWCHAEYKVSDNIPATEENLELLFKAFHIKF